MIVQLIAVTIVLGAVWVALFNAVADSHFTPIRPVVLVLEVIAQTGFIAATAFTLLYIAYTAMLTY